MFNFFRKRMFNSFEKRHLGLDGKEVWCRLMGDGIVDIGINYGHPTSLNRAGGLVSLVFL